MIRIALAPRVLDDLDRILDRILDHLSEHEVPNAGERAAAIVSALDILREHPRIGRPAEHGLRELIIGRDARGYIALYQYNAGDDEVRVLAVRAQREAGYGPAGPDR